jgi:hypothetical protein
MEERDVCLELSGDEALVLFELLAQWEESGRLKEIDDSGRIVLSGILCDLESRLVVPFGPSHEELVEAARARVRARES